MTRFRHLFVVAAGLLLGGFATADPISVTFEGVGPNVGNAGQYNWNTGATTYEGLVYDPFGNGSLSATHFVTFCIEQTQHVSGGSTYTGYQFALLTGGPFPGTPMSPATADALSMMWAEFFDTLDTAAESAAFQHAVWHLVDPNHNPSLSSVQDGYYDDYLNPTNWKSGLANLAVMRNGSQQDQIFQLKAGYTVVDGEIVPTPEPTTLLLGLLAVPAVAVGLRRKRAA